MLKRSLVVAPHRQKQKVVMRPNFRISIALNRNLFQQQLLLDISNNLSWNPHINKIVNKANSKLGFIKRNLKCIPQSIKIYAYRSLVRPHLEYCCPVWDPYTIRNINHLEGVQHRAARFVAHNYSWETSGCLCPLLANPGPEEG